MSEVRLKRILIVASHPAAGYSMQRYSSLLAKAWRDGGWVVDVFEPANVFAKALGMVSARLTKWGIYLDQFVLSALRFYVGSNRADVVCLADHSDAVYFALYLPPKPTIATVHDLIAVRAALGDIVEKWDVGRAGKFYQRLVRRGLRRAMILVAVSRATRDDCRRVIGREARVIPNALDPGIVPRPGRRARGPFLLIVSSSGWRKRRDLAVRAWTHLRRTAAMQDVSLTIVGPPMTSEEKQIVPAHLRSLITIENSISDLRLGELYGTCTAVVLLSLYEGFGWPVVEANVHGKPALCSPIAALTETGQGGAVYVDPKYIEDRNWEEVAEALIAIGQTDLPVRNADRFSWMHYAKSIKSLGMELAVRTA